MTVKRTIYSTWNSVVSINNITDTTLKKLSDKFDTPIVNGVITLIRDGQKLTYEKI